MVAAKTFKESYPLNLWRFTFRSTNSRFSKINFSSITMMVHVPLVSPVDQTAPRSSENLSQTCMTWSFNINMTVPFTFSPRTSFTKRPRKKPRLKKQPKRMIPRNIYNLGSNRRTTDTCNFSYHWRSSWSNMAYRTPGCMTFLPLSNNRALPERYSSSLVSLCSLCSELRLLFSLSSPGTLAFPIWKNGWPLSSHEWNGLIVIDWYEDENER